MDQKLSKRQQQVYDFIEAYIKEKGFGPTVREIGDALQLSSPSTVHVHLKTLEEKGYITRDQLKSRSIALTHESDSSETFGSAAFDNTISLPLIAALRW